LNSRLLIALLFLLLSSILVNGQVFQITTRMIEIDVDEGGSAEITEKFFLGFPNEFHLQEFRNESEKIGVDLDAWQQFNPAFKPSIGRGGEVRVSDIGFVENDSKYLEMKYTLNEPLMEREKETSRMVKFSLKGKFFNNFLEGSFWVIPSTVTIVVDLPLQVEIEQPVKPEANVSGNRIVWTGYKSTNVLSLKYILWKQIASFNLNEIVDNLNKSGALPLLVIGIALFAFAVLWKRKAIAAKIEAYITEHSNLSGVEEEE